MRILSKTSGFYAAIRNLHVDAFPSPAEADLVERLRVDGDARIELMALEAGRVIGHVVFSAMSAPFKALGLAPIAVVVDRRRQGIAISLIEKGIERATVEGWEGIFVLGDPNFYGQFGFSADAATAFGCRWSGPHFMLRAIRSDLSSRPAPVGYAPAFSALI